MTDSPLVYRCPAKVNLALSVGAPRDTAEMAGYHPIASWMVAVDLFDDLQATPGEGPSTFDIDWADDAPAATPIDWPVESDLVYRAHALLEREAGQPLPVNVVLRKRIPAGAGLAGGSSDAATMLMTLDELFELRLPQERLIDLSGQLGSDLAFFFADGSAVVTGRGETLQPAPMDRPTHLCLIMPAFGCATGAVYSKFDELSPGAALDEERVLRAVHGEVDCFNDLAEAACAVQPQLDVLRKQIAELTTYAVHVTGSGSGMFIVATGASHAGALAAQVTAATGVATQAVMTIGG